MLKIIEIIDKLRVLLDSSTEINTNISDIWLSVEEGTMKPKCIFKYDNEQRINVDEVIFGEYSGNIENNTKVELNYQIRHLGFYSESLYVQDEHIYWQKTLNWLRESKGIVVTPIAVPITNILGKTELKYKVEIWDENSSEKYVLYHSNSADECIFEFWNAVIIGIFYATNFVKKCL